MNYLDYIFSTDTIKPIWLTKDKEFSGGYMKPDWMKLINQGINSIKDDITKFRILDEKDPTKNNKTSSGIIDEPLSNIIKYRLNGDIRPGFPRNKWSRNNFSTASVKSS